MAQTSLFTSNNTAVSGDANSGDLNMATASNTACRVDVVMTVGVYCVVQGKDLNGNYFCLTKPLKHDFHASFGAGGEYPGVVPDTIRISWGLIAPTTSGTISVSVIAR